MKCLTKANSCILCLLLIFAPLLHGSSFPNGIKYLGGPGYPDHKQVRNSWNNGLHITNTEITFSFNKNLIPSETISLAAVNRITYGQATTRRVGRWIAVGILLAPVALFGMFHKSRQHRVLIEWTDDQERDRGLLMQVHKKHFVGLLNDLSFRSNQPIYADADDREWLFRSGVKAELDDTVANEN